MSIGHCLSSRARLRSEPSLSGQASYTVDPTLPLRDGLIDVGASGKVFLTPTIYSSGTQAQAELALPSKPVGYFEIPRDRLANLFGPNWPVDPNYGQPGGGIEYWTTLEILATGLQWVPIGP